MACGEGFRRVIVKGCRDGSVTVDGQRMWGGNMIALRRKTGARSAMKRPSQILPIIFGAVSGLLSSVSGLLTIVSGLLIPMSGLLTEITHWVNVEMHCVNAKTCDVTLISHLSPLKSYLIPHTSNPSHQTLHRILLYHSTLSAR